MRVNLKGPVFRALEIYVRKYMCVNIRGYIFAHEKKIKIKRKIKDANVKKCLWREKQRFATYTVQLL